MPKPYRSPCPLASALDLVGDRWSLVVLRTMFAGARQFRDFEQAPERIATNILSNRLKALEANGLIERTIGEDGRPAYRLSRMGADLLPALQALAAWGLANIPGRWTPPDWFTKGRAMDWYPPAAPPGKTAKRPVRRKPK